MKLVIISHTEHYKQDDGTVVGWGPTISEINYLAPYFEEIVHLAFLHSEEAPPSSLPYTQPNIRFEPLPVQGGKTLLKKFGIITAIPKTLGVIRKVLKEVDAFQLRTPTGMGVYLIPYLTFFVRKKGWFKYAGNWKQVNPPFGYRLQRWLLKNQSRLVTINGSWPDQPKNCITFENPCLTAEDRKKGLEIIAKRLFSPPYTFLFVGRLEDEKGVQRILNAFSELQHDSIACEVHFVGSGPKRNHYEQFAKNHSIKARFHGFLSRNDVFELYQKCSFLLLPSKASEGFPKVIAEAMNFGCLPIVSNISSIGQYVTPENGFIVSPVTGQALSEVLTTINIETKEALMVKANAGHAKVHCFAFDYYNKRILSEILNLRPSE